MQFPGDPVPDVRNAWSFLCRDVRGFLQSKDISTRHHEMRRKRMAQNVCQLTAREHDRRFSITDKN